MLYETHKRYGQVAGLVMLPVAVSTGIVDLDMNFGFEGFVSEVLVVLFYAFIALKASMFGAEFPDLDSPGSTPSRKHKILSSMFKISGVKHRGKFSHDFVSQTILWGIIYGLVSYVGSTYAVNEIGLFILSAVKVYVFFTFIGVLSHLIADAMTVDGVWFLWMFKVRFMPVFIRKFGVGSWKPFKTWFTTGSEWNHINYVGMSIILPVAGLFAVYQLFIVS